VHIDLRPAVFTGHALLDQAVVHRDDGENSDDRQAGDHEGCDEFRFHERAFPFDGST
jgi:hypothetical protein